MKQLNRTIVLHRQLHVFPQQHEQLRRRLQQLSASIFCIGNAPLISLYLLSVFVSRCGYSTHV